MFVEGKDFGFRFRVAPAPSAVLPKNLISILRDFPPDDSKGSSPKEVRLASHVWVRAGLPTRCDVGTYGFRWLSV
jgi:hypothetical protein